MGRKLYSVGFNAFQQTGQEKEVVTQVPQCHLNVNKVLYANWETTIVMNDAGKVVIWGFKPEWFDRVESLISKEKKVKSIFGDPNEVLGILTGEGTISYATATETVKDKYTAVEQAVYCSSLKCIFILFKTGIAQQLSLDRNESTELSLPSVKKICASNTHVLFLTTDQFAPIYALGSNRFSQCGMDYHDQQALEKPATIEYFSGLGQVTDIACGLFHSAVIVKGDLYTFGINRDGRLGWGGKQEEEDLISCAVFLDRDEEPVEVYATKVVCGSSHTLALDNRGNLWSCGSNKYAQLGREITPESDENFRQCSIITDKKTEKIIDIYASRWSSFILTINTLI